MRKVRCIETKRVFNNSIEAGEWLGVSEITIRSACNGNIEKAKGLTFEYVIEKPKRQKRVIQEEIKWVADETSELKEITPEDFKDKKWGTVILSKINEIIRYSKENK